MATRENFYLFKFGERVSSGVLRDETKVEWKGELVLHDENLNPIGSVGALENDDEGKLAEVVINNDDFDKSKYKDELAVDKLYTPTDNYDDTLPQFKPSRVHLELSET